MPPLMLRHCSQNTADRTYIRPVNIDVNSAILSFSRAEPERVYFITSLTVRYIRRKTSTPKKPDIRFIRKAMSPAGIREKSFSIRVNNG
ncbi:MAG: hypothetical protein BWY84_00696 [Candidatus Aerophobetes bacterium ADurb.Bin490]|nr:MAG: hypothetical protein BWY84_00696 [Candidatus Aerophobetes bacterium ADurb.Bin490]